MLTQGFSLLSRCCHRRWMDELPGGFLFLFLFLILSCFSEDRLFLQIHWAGPVRSFLHTPPLKCTIITVCMGTVWPLVLWHICGDQRPALRSQFSPSTFRFARGLELTSTGLHIEHLYPLSRPSLRLPLTVFPMAVIGIAGHIYWNIVPSVGNLRWTKTHDLHSIHSLDCTVLWVSANE